MMIWQTNQQLDSEYADRMVLEQLDDAGIGFLPKDESYKAYERDYGAHKDGNALVGFVNVCKFYGCCALIFGAAYLFAKVLTK